MSRYVLVIPPLAAAALLAGCASDPVQPAPVVVTPAPAPTTVVTAPPATTTAPAVVTATAIRAGAGRIESVAALPPSAAAGGTSAASLRRVGIKMDDGTVQYVDTTAQWVSLGDRVELTADGQIRRL